MLDFNKEERKSNYILDAYENSERTRYSIYEFVEMQKHLGELPEEFKLPCDQWKISFKDSVVKIYIPECPPCTSAYDFYQKFKRRWIKNMVETINLLENKPHYDKAFVVISIYAPRKDWDVDNREYKPIIDGIRYSKIVKSDCFNHLAFSVVGNYSKNSHTEVSIIDCILFENFIKTFEI